MVYWKVYGLFNSSDVLFRTVPTQINSPDYRDIRQAMWRLREQGYRVTRVKMGGSNAVV